ncbi:hypothetical protein BU23DRAFT_165364 [Bimuria novae-zelandiae CBS 107.79]|uniref:Uncharacterized protein n=1 Tax=Bimuria novae-zelandiae CBS 107.79 TaxID=1447943 RepID=A0A6A5V4D5_9PLEO|nr:hypothetical protein BU23DRAFT_165364 [Bimuria novae-zelandiae CBS 107.79]
MLSVAGPIMWNSSRLQSAPGREMFRKMRSCLVMDIYVRVLSALLDLVLLLFLRNCRIRNLLRCIFRNAGCAFADRSPPSPFTAADFLEETCVKEVPRLTDPTEPGCEIAVPRGFQSCKLPQLVFLDSVAGYQDLPAACWILAAGLVEEAVMAMLSSMHHAGVLIVLTESAKNIFFSLACIVGRFRIFQGSKELDCMPCRLPRRSKSCSCCF